MFLAFTIAASQEEHAVTTFASAIETGVRVDDLVNLSRANAERLRVQVRGEYEKINDDGGGWYHVVDVHTWDGVAYVYDGNGAPAGMRTLLDRTGATQCYDKASTPGCDTPHAHESRALVGFDRVTIKRFGRNAQNQWRALTEQEMTFDIGQNGVAYWLNGRALSSTTKDSATGDVYAEQTSSWSWDGTNYFARLDAETDTTYDPANGFSLGIKKEYDYNPAYQDGRQWGYPTWITFSEIEKREKRQNFITMPTDSG